MTIIEVLSPKNKQIGIGRLQYETKRLKILGSGTNFVEIDLLRQGNSMPMVVNFLPSHYRMVVSHSETRPKAQFYGFNLPDRIPEFPVPLRSGEVQPTIHLKGLLDEIYDQGSYDLRIDYNRSPIPALSEVDMAWVNERLPQQELRTERYNPWRENALELVYELQLNLNVNREQKSELDAEEDETLMRAITPLFQEHLAAAEQRGEQRGVQQGIERGKIQGKIEGVQEGIQRGIQEENRAILENFLRVRFGVLEPKSAVFITPVSTLPAVDFTMLLVQLSILSVDESGVKRATELLAESVLRMRFGQLDERLTNVIPSLLALSLEDLGLLLSLLPQLSIDELLGRLDNSAS